MDFYLNLSTMSGYPTSKGDTLGLYVGHNIRLTWGGTTLDLHGGGTTLDLHGGGTTLNLHGGGHHITCRLTWGGGAPHHSSLET